MGNTPEIFDLWHDFVNGDDGAYEVLYSTFADSLYSYGHLFTQDGELIKDCIQDVFVSLYRKRSPDFMPRNVRLYIMASLRNSLLNALSRSSRQTVYDRDDMESSIQRATEPTVEEEYIKDEALRARSEKVNEVMEVLAPRQREIIYYRFVQGMDMGEICALMELNYQSAQNLIQRALKKIRDKYASE